MTDAVSGWVRRLVTAAAVTAAGLAVAVGILRVTYSLMDFGDVVDGRAHNLWFEVGGESCTFKVTGDREVFGRGTQWHRSYEREFCALLCDGDRVVRYSGVWYEKGTARQATRHCP